jgi:hypothetical protein
MPVKHSGASLWPLFVYIPLSPKKTEPDRGPVIPQGLGFGYPEGYKKME